MEMNPLHERLSQILSEKLTKRRIVIWYDPQSEFAGFVGELSGGNVPTQCRLEEVSVGEIKTRLCVLESSFFEVKFLVEPYVASDFPDPLLIYLPGKLHNDETAVLMELEAGGDRWEPQLKREARRVLKKRFGDGQIDRMLESPNITYQDIVGLLDGHHDNPVTGSLLELIYSEAHGNAAVLAAWIASKNRDDDVLAKGANTELRQLIGARLGLELTGDTTLEDARRKTARYVLLGEFRSDLHGEPPSTLSLVGRPSSKQLELVLDIAKILRDKHPKEYVVLADGIEQELRLSSQGISPDDLGRIDTFRFEEMMLLEHVGHLIVEGQFTKAMEIVSHRHISFWALYQFKRQEQWQAYGLAAELGLVITEIAKQLPDSKKTSVHWIEGYTAENGWYKADLLHRRLEAILSSMTDPIASEKVVHRIRKDYESLVDRMTSSFIPAFSRSDWAISGIMYQTEIYSKEVQNRSETVCFILVDALRYEMGVELKGLLEGAQELSLQVAIGTIPTITQIGMAALMPGAEKAFSVVEYEKDIGAKIEGSLAGNLNDRKKIWKGRVPNMVDFELDKVLSHSNAQLQKRIADAPLVLVRSWEIDAMGEGGNTSLARQVMDTAINNVARAIKRLAGLGIAKFVVAADHGFLFIHERDESQRIEKPGGVQATLHRRCWAGRGGTTPPSTVRITASQLGYDSDLDFVFPTNNSVFKAGGDLAFYHGGLSLQELLIPVLSIRMPTAKQVGPTNVDVILSDFPKQIVNRIVTFKLLVQSSVFTNEDVIVRPVLLNEGQHVGHVGMVLDAEHDRLTHCVRIKSGCSCTVGVQLLRDDINNVEIVVLDPDTDLILAKSDKIPVKLGI